jgi:cobalt-zinc-cadmium resistance protein CzcA
LGFALLGALIFTLTLVPVLSHVLLNKDVKEKNNSFSKFWNNITEKAFIWTFSHKRISLSVALIIMLLTLMSTKFLGTEFMPQLNEGALWVEAKYPMSQSLDETVKRVAVLRKILNGFEEVNGVLSQTGRSNDGTEPCGFYYVQMQVNLKPRSQWKRRITYDELVDQMDKKLQNYQGIIYNYSQPIIDNVAEAVVGFNADNGVKIYGNDLDKLDLIADQVVGKMQNVYGIRDLGVMRNLGQPEISVMLDREKMAAFGVTPSDAQTVL